MQSNKLPTFKTERRDYVLTHRTSGDVVLAYLFPDELRYWEKKGYLAFQRDWPK